MTRKRALECITAAAAAGEDQTALRLYVENRISFAAYQEAYRKGKKFAEFVRKREEAAAKAEGSGLPTYEDLIEAYHCGAATLPVDRFNHREFVMQGVRYFCGFDSKKRIGWPEPRWFTYKSEPEAGAQ